MANEVATVCVEASDDFASYALRANAGVRHTFWNNTKMHPP